MQTPAQCPRPSHTAAAYHLVHSAMHITVSNRLQVLPTRTALPTETVAAPVLSVPAPAVYGYGIHRQ